MIEIGTGEVTLIADQPDAESTLCGSPSWSSDGPAQGKVKEVLWKANFKREGLDVRPTFPAYLPSTGLCVFIGRKAGKALYSFQRGQPDKLKRLEPAGSDKTMRDVALSPDGRYALFASGRAGQRQGGSAPAAGAPRPKESGSR